MAYADTQYQINQLKAELKDVQNQLRAANPGNRPSRGPQHPLRVVTSIGQTTAGADSDNFSRAINAAVEQGLAGAESLQDVATAGIGTVVNFGGGVTQSLYKTDYLRPDPVVNDVYRLTAAGNMSELAALGVQAIAFQFRISGGPVNTLGIFALGDNDAYWWWLHLIFVITVAGPAGTYTVTSRITDSNPLVAVTGTQVNQDFLYDNSTGPVNLVTPVPELLVNSTIASAAMHVSLDSYVLERMGSSSPNKV